jgi:hypothetical protein
MKPINEEDSIFIRVENEKESIELQNMLFSIGIFWEGRKNYFKPMYTDAEMLIIYGKDKLIGYSHYDNTEINNLREYYSTFQFFKKKYKLHFINLL